MIEIQVGKIKLGAYTDSDSVEMEVTFGSRDPETVQLKYDDLIDLQYAAMKLRKQLQKDLPDYKRPPI